MAWLRGYRANCWCWNSRTKTKSWIGWT
uniref:Uncharacterized protein n=1 Tax=Rhizophora mucronata TaxID=61149 RepID=A0A2P2N971_RHIMU